mmetsp:Transcript_42572/g.81407  ORF Transcript_42572/g.81407 Transcript_42572/m.81407 type:complete len:163 (-) Transcript_42572:206-694(-)|eukprot:CAMPEP_0172690792 /NCGR_PEP_ID=MMETSP1074-20121228/24106_1 /TAXON_ID=2916 /ORGANISM="Ceratium fusus, Strain PA161109" /LENGTH=162 /DNA_ID=CAMNT_0013510781 /DNA_START=417 /DNA_END=905 /DNA_ORIENTATION=+
MKNSFTQLQPCEAARGRWSKPKANQPIKEVQKEYGSPDGVSVSISLQHYGNAGGGKTESKHPETWKRWINAWRGVHHNATKRNERIWGRLTERKHQRAPDHGAIVAVHVHMELPIASRKQPADGSCKFVNVLADGTMLQQATHRRTVGDDTIALRQVELPQP